MMTTQKRETKEDRSLLPLLAAGAIVLVVAALAAAWRNYQLATDQSWLSQFSHAIIGLLPASWQTAATDQARAMGLPGWWSEPRKAISSGFLSWSSGRHLLLPASLSLPSRCWLH